jgi:hypothetical protein
VGKFLITTIFCSGFLLLPTAARADTIWLNELGQANLNAKEGPHFGVIRKFTDQAFEWQPYKKNWAKPVQYTVIYWFHVSKIKHSLDTYTDMAHMVRNVQRNMVLAIPEVKAKLTGKERALFPKLNATFIIQSIIENMSRYEAFRQEADTGVTKQGINNLRILLKFWADPKRYNKSSTQAMAKEYRAMGVEARRGLLGIIANAKRLLTKRSATSFNIRDLDPIDFGTHALKFVPELSWKLKGVENDRTGQDEEIVRLLLDILASKYQLTSNKQRFFAQAEKQLKHLVQNSQRARKYLIDEFARADEARKGAAALILTKCATSDKNGGAQVEIAKAGTRYLLNLVRNQSNKRTQLSHPSRLLAHLMTLHPAAYKEVQQCIESLKKGKSAKKKLLEDRLFLATLQKCKFLADRHSAKTNKAK